MTVVHSKPLGILVKIAATSPLGNSYLASAPPPPTSGEDTVACGRKILLKSIDERTGEM